MSTNGKQRKTELEIVEGLDHPDLGAPPSLREEILTGQLMLRADNLSRATFSFSVGDYAIGVYGARSMGPGSLAIIRRWNHRKETFDPISGLTIVNEGRQFDRIHEGDPLFLVEYTSDMLAVTSRVAFKANRVRVCDAELPGMPEEMRFEMIELREVEILG